MMASVVYGLIVELPPPAPPTPPTDTGAGQTIFVVKMRTTY